MSATAINQLIETRVDEALVNQEQLKNNGVNRDGSQNLRSGTERPTRTPRECTFKDLLNCRSCLSNSVTVGHDVAYDMPWKTLMKMMTVKYCTRSEIKKLEIGIWNLKESDEVEKYVSGLLDMIQGNVMSTRPKTIQEAIELANDLMDQKIVVQAYTVGSGEKKEYAGTLPLCNKCKFHHHGPCTVKCANYKKVGHLTRDFWNPTTANNQRTITYYECRNQGHYRSDYPKIMNLKHGNQVEDNKAHRLVYDLGGEETEQDPNNIEDEIKVQEEDFLASTSEP
nr:hypothetical protein [Tanacetum cinerariifolium]